MWNAVRKPKKILLKYSKKLQDQFYSIENYNKRQKERRKDYAQFYEYFVNI
jgi:hypothetical protein